MREWLVRASGILVVSLALAASARAATFQGRVLGPAGVPVADARVAIDGEGRGLHRTASTDGDGRFTFPELAPGPALSPDR